MPPYRLMDQKENVLERNLVNGQKALFQEFCVNVFLTHNESS